MKTLLLMRHAKSSWSEASLADHERPLNKRGKRDAPQMGELLKREGQTPAQIVSSTAVRARNTAAKVAEACDYKGTIEVTRDLYHAGTRSFLSVLSELYYPTSPVLVVGHNPGMEEFFELLVDDYECFPTAAIAQISLPIDHWNELDVHTDAVCINFWRPKDMEF